MKKRYPLIVRFKNEEISWTKFFISTVYYLSKLKEEWKLPYIPTLDFDPKHIYTVLSHHPEMKILIPSIAHSYRQTYNKEYHTIVRLINDKYVIDPYLTQGTSIGSFFASNILEKEGEDILNIKKKELYVDKDRKMRKEWLTLELENGKDTNFGLHADEKSAELFLFHNYVSLIEDFVQLIFHDFDMNEKQAILQHSTLHPEWRNFEKFQESFYLYTNIGDIKPDRFDFQLIHLYF
jgi:hypothetical protein